MLRATKVKANTHIDVERTLVAWHSIYLNTQDRISIRGVNPSRIDEVHTDKHIYHRRVDIESKAEHAQPIVVKEGMRNRCRQPIRWTQVERRRNIGVEHRLAEPIVREQADGHMVAQEVILQARIYRAVEHRSIAIAIRHLVDIEIKVAVGLHLRGLKVYTIKAKVTTDISTNAILAIPLDKAQIRNRQR